MEKYMYRRWIWRMRTMICGSYFTDIKLSSKAFGCLFYVINLYFLSASLLSNVPGPSCCPPLSRPRPSQWIMQRFLSPAWLNRMSWRSFTFHDWFCSKPRYHGVAVWRKHFKRHQTRKLVLNRNKVKTRVPSNDHLGVRKYKDWKWSLKLLFLHFTLQNPCYSKYKNEGRLSLSSKPRRCLALREASPGSQPPGIGTTWPNTRVHPSTHVSQDTQFYPEYTVAVSSRFLGYGSRPPGRSALRP